MSITDYVAVYAAFVATAILVWFIWEHRKYVQFAAYVTGRENGTLVELHVTNKTKLPIVIKHICFIDEDRSPYTFACPASPFWRNEPMTIGDEALKTLTLENEAKCIFRLNMARIKQEFDEGYRYMFTHVGIIDTAGKIYRQRIPKELLDLLRD